MRGKNKGKSRRPKPPRVTSSVFFAQPHQSWRVPLSRLLETGYSVIPERVGSDLSFTKFADEIEPAIFGEIVKCQSFPVAIPKFYIQQWLKFTKLVSTIAMRVMFPLGAFIGFDMKDMAWFEYLTLDAAYLHVTVFGAEAFIDKLLGQSNHTPNPEATQHFVKGVQLLRERLFVGDEEAKVSNSTLSVVLILAMSAHNTGEYETGKQHMEGLCKMVNLRGGLSAFRGSKLLMLMLRYVVALPHI
jgi:hypothetical protein